VTSSRDARKTLVVMPNWVGDCVMAWPVLEALAADGRQLSVLAKPHLEALLRLAPGEPSFLQRGASDETVVRIREGAFDEAVVLPNSFRSAWLPLSAEVPRRYGYRGDLRTLLLNPSVRRPSRRDRRPQVEDYRELLAAMGVAAPASWAPRLELPAELVRAGAERLARAGIDVGKHHPLIGVFPGAEFGPSKRWPWRRFAELLLDLRRGLGDAGQPAFRGIIVAGPKEVWTAVRVHEESGKIHPVIGPDLDLARLAGVLSHLDVLVTNDSGPMHLAAALGVRCVALFGPTDPRRTAPALAERERRDPATNGDSPDGYGHRVLWRDPWCAPCFRRRCPLLHHGCMRGIGVTEVSRVTQELLLHPTNSSEGRP
jgi:heptosyltransferase-2